MIELGPTDFVPLEQFQRAWRFNDAKHNVLPTAALADIRPLTTARAAAFNVPLTKPCAGYYADPSKAPNEFSADSSNVESVARTAAGSPSYLSPTRNA
jgi:hypothetical protein